MPCRRQRSFVSAPASESLSTPMICSSVNRFPFIELSFPKSMENSKPRSGSFRGQGQRREESPGGGRSSQERNGRSARRGREDRVRGGRESLQHPRPFFRRGLGFLRAQRRGLLVGWVVSSPGLCGFGLGGAALVLGAASL